MFSFNQWNMAEPMDMFLVRPDDAVVCQLNGVDAESASITTNLNNQYELTFDYNKYIDVDGTLVESNGYDYLNVNMRILVRGIGLFKMSEPPYNYDGNTDKKSITAMSIESELEDKNIEIKINTGEEDSMEYLVEYDTEETEPLINEYTGLPYDYIMFYNTLPQVLAGISYNDGEYTDQETIDDIVKYCTLIPRLKSVVYKDDVTGESTLEEFVFYDYDATGETITKVTLTNFNDRVDDLITFYTKYRSQLSLLDIILNSVDAAWTVGTIQPELCNTKYQFDVNTNVYAFLTQDIASAAEVVFSFDLYKCQINAEKAETIGKDSSVILSRRNFIDNLEISCDDANLITRYAVSGGNDASVKFYNFGEDRIDDISYFLNLKDKNGKRVYVTDALAEKYGQFVEDRDSARDDYADLTRQYNQLMMDIDEIKYRLPNDIVKTDYTSYTDEELSASVISYNNMIVVIKQLYRDDYGDRGLNPDGSINETFMKTTPYWVDYFCYIQALEQVEKVISDRASAGTEPPTPQDIAETIERYKTEWTLYGTVELASMINSFKRKLQVFVDGQSIGLKHYYKLWTDMDVDERYQYHNDEREYDAAMHTWKTLSPATQATYKNYEDAYRYEPKTWSQLSPDEKLLYGSLEINYYYDTYYENYQNMCNAHEYYVGLQTQVEDLESDLSLIQERRNDLANLASIKGYDEEHFSTILNWILTHEAGDQRPTWVPSFTDKEIKTITRLYIDGTYENENIILTTLDTTVTQVDIAKELYEDAVEHLSIDSQPQFEFSATIDNLMCMKDFEGYDFVPGNFVYLEYFDGYYIKLRLASVTFNPRNPQSDIEITFTNYTRSNAKRSDLSYILDSASGGKSSRSSSGGSGGSGTGDSLGSKIDITLSNTMLAQLLNTEMFGSRVSDVILDTIKANEITAKYASFNALDVGDVSINGKGIKTGWIVDQSYNGTITTDQQGNEYADVDNTEGTIINLETGKFSFAGGKLKWYTKANNQWVMTVGGFNISTNQIYYTMESDDHKHQYQILMQNLMSTEEPRPESLAFRVANRSRDSVNDDWPTSWNQPFVIRYNGEITATNATITGTITGSTISGSTFIGSTSNSYIESKNYTYSSGDYSTTGIHIDLSNNGYIRSKNFALTSSGNVYVKGEISASSGDIGGFDISSDRIQSVMTIDNQDHTQTQYRIVMLSMGESSDETRRAIYIGVRTRASSSAEWGTLSYPFQVRYNGEMTATNAIITGTISASTISGSTFVGSTSNSYIESKNYTYSSGNYSTTGIHIDLSNNGYIRSKNFALTSSGNVYVKGEISASSGDIGGFDISSDRIQSVMTKGNNQYRIVMLSMDESDDETRRAFYIGVRTRESPSAEWGTLSYPFCVRYNGEMTATNAIITGTISGSTISGSTFVGSTSNSYIESKNYTYSSGDYSTTGIHIDLSNNGYIRSKNFALTSSGDVYVKGDITATNLSAKDNIAVYDANNRKQNAISAVLGSSGNTLYIGGGVDASGQPDNSSFATLYMKASSIVIAATPILQILEDSSGALACGPINCGAITCSSVTATSIKDYGDDVRRAVGSIATDGRRVQYLATTGTDTFAVRAQWNSTTAYSAKSISFSSSDARLKQNIGDTTTLALPVINQIRMRQFDWKQTGVHQNLGFVADELELIDKRFAIGGGYDEDGCINIKSVDTFYLLGYAVKAIQELSAEVDRLKKQINK